MVVSAYLHGTSVLVPVPHNYPDTSPIFTNSLLICSAQFKRTLWELLGDLLEKLLKFKSVA